LLVAARVQRVSGDAVGAATSLIQAAGAPGDTSSALDLLNQWFVGEVARVGDGLLTRIRAPMPDEAFVALVELRERPLPRALPGQPLRLEAIVRNQSGVVWPALGNEDGGLRVALGARWIVSETGERREAGRRPLPRDLGPNEEVSLEFRVQAPVEPGSYVLRLDMVQEGISWFGDRDTRTVVTVPIQVDEVPP
jgi:hypothetical protein